MHWTKAKLFGLRDENLGGADGVCRPELGSGCEPIEGNPNTEGEESHDPNSKICVWKDMKKADE